MPRATRVLLLLALAACSSPAPEPPPLPDAAPEAPPPEPAAIEAPAESGAAGLFGALRPATPEEAVDLVRALNTEPYAGLLRGPAGTWASRAGNAIDKAALLAELLRRQGKSVRFAHAKLNDAQIDAVLEGFDLGSSPPAWATATDDPRRRPEIRAAVADHVWVEYRDGERWTVADPTFPGLAPGAAAATSEPPWTEIPRDRVHTVTLTWVERREGRDEVLLKLEKPAHELAAVSVRLVAKLVPYKRPLKPGEKVYVPPPVMVPIIDIAGMPKPPPPPPAPPPPKLAAPTEVRLQRTLMVGDASSPALVKGRPVSAMAAAERVDVLIRGPGYSRKFSRDLLDAGTGVAPLREHDVLVVVGEVSRGAVNDEVRPTSGFLPEGWVSTLAKGGPVEREQLGAAIVPRAARALLLASVAESDAATARIAVDARALVLYDRPRIAFADRTTAWEGDDATSVTATVAVDFRENGATIVPATGTPAALTRLVERARGVATAAAVDAVFTRAVGAPEATAARVWAASRRVGGPMRVFEPAAKVELPGPEGVRIGAAVAAGHRVVATDPAGSSPWRAWWEIDPSDGAWGVALDGGVQARASQTGLPVADAWDDEAGYVRGLYNGEAQLAARWSVPLAGYPGLEAALTADVRATTAPFACVGCPAPAPVDCTVEPAPAADACGSDAVALACAVGLALADDAWSPTAAFPASEAACAAIP